MYLDASAIIAILNSEADREALKSAIEKENDILCVSPLTIFEAATGLARARLGSATRKATAAELALAHAAVRSFMKALDIREIEVGNGIGLRALEAAAKYGRVVGHPADLNFGDCFAYACAKFLGTALLFKGDDFSKTDIMS
jgi:ribonuclease VapC